MGVRISCAFFSLHLVSHRLSAYLFLFPVFLPPLMSAGRIQQKTIRSLASQSHLKRDILTNPTRDGLSPALCRHGGRGGRPFWFGWPRGNRAVAQRRAAMEQASYCPCCPWRRHSRGRPRRHSDFFTERKPPQVRVAPVCRWGCPVNSVQARRIGWRRGAAAA